MDTLDNETEVRRMVREMAVWDDQKKYHRLQGISAPFWRWSNILKDGKATKNVWCLVIADELEKMDSEWQRHTREPYHPDRKKGF